MNNKIKVHANWVIPGRIVHADSKNDKDKVNIWVFHNFMQNICTSNKSKQMRIVKFYVHTHLNDTCRHKVET